MSPSEFQLRAALRDGEGDGLDPEVAIGRALQVRHARRVRVVSVAAAIVLAGAVSGTVALTRGSTGSNDSGARSADHLGAAGAATAPVAAPSAAAAASSAAAAGSDAAGSIEAGPGVPLPSAIDGRSVPALGVSCPTTALVLSLPANTGGFGASGPLFGQPVAAVLVCGYPIQGGAARSIELTDTDATTFVASLENADTQLVPLPCPSSAQLADRPRLDVLAVTASGAVLPPVVVTLTCNGTTTNGTAVRYNWAAPTAYAQIVKELTGQLSTQDSIAPKREDGSPPA